MDKSLINYEYEFLLQNDKIEHFLMPVSQLSHSDAQQRLLEIVFNGCASRDLKKEEEEETIKNAK